MPSWSQGVLVASLGCGKPFIFLRGSSGSSSTDFPLPAISSKLAVTLPRDHWSNTEGVPRLAIFDMQKVFISVL